MNGLLLVAAAAGIALGMFFYAGLWFTVNRLPSSRHPFLLTLASYWIRTMAVAGAALYFAGRGWPSVVALLFGIMSGRLAVTVLTKRGGTLVKCT